MPYAFGAKYAHPDRPVIAVDDPDAVGSAWDEAWPAQEPVVLDMRTDPEVPPIPPHATHDEMKSMAEATL